MDIETKKILKDLSTTITTAFASVVEIMDENSTNVKQLPNHFAKVMLDNSGMNEKKTYVNIDSRCRYSGTPSNFVVNIPRQENIKKITLETAEIPNAIPLISSTRGNNVFYLSYNGGAYQTITIPNGSYDYISFAAALQTVLQVVNANFTVSINVGTSTTAADYKLTIRNTAATFSINYGSTLTTSQLLKNNLGDIMGFVPISNNSVVTYTATLVGSDYVLTSPGAVNLEGENYVYIYISGIGGYLQDCFSNINHFKVPIRVGTGSIEFYTNNSDYNSMLYQRDNQTTLVNLNVVLKSAWGDTIDNSNKEWSFMLSFLSY